MRIKSAAELEAAAAAAQQQQRQQLQLQTPSFSSPASSSNNSFSLPSSLSASFNNIDQLLSAKPPQQQPTPMRPPPIQTNFEENKLQFNNPRPYTTTTFAAPLPQIASPASSSSSATTTLRTTEEEKKTLPSSLATKIQSSSPPTAAAATAATALETQSNGSLFSFASSFIPAWLSSSSKPADASPSSATSTTSSSSSSSASSSRSSNPKFSPTSHFFPYPLPSSPEAVYNPEESYHYHFYGLPYDAPLEQVKHELLTILKSVSKKLLSWDVKSNHNKKTCFAFAELQLNPSTAQRVFLRDGVVVCGRRAKVILNKSTRSPSTGKGAHGANSSESTMKVAADSFNLGFRSQENEFTYKYQSITHGCDDIVLKVDLDKRKLIVEFNIMGDVHQIKYDVSIIETCGWQQSFQHLFIVSHSPPKLYKHTDGDLMQIWDFTQQFAECEALRLDLNQKNKVDNEQFVSQLEKKLSHFHIGMWKQNVGSKLIRSRPAPSAAQRGLSLEIKLHLEKLFSNRLLNRDTCQEAFYYYLNELNQEDHSLSIFFLQHYVPEYCLEGIVYNPLKLIEQFFEQKAAGEVSAKGAATRYKHQDRINVFRVVITPSAKIFEGPEYVMSNRVIRKAMDEYRIPIYHFLRVLFQNEGNESLSSEESSSMLFDHFAGEMKLGVNVGDTKFELLGWSNSQLKEHACWYFAPFQSASHGLITAEGLRRTLGTFSDKTVSKYAARLGQCFTTSKDSIEIKFYRTIPDEIIGGENFSDGIGMIDPAVANKICKVMNRAEPFSAIQIRFGGHKGVLSIAPGSLGGYDICTRPSMEKFSSKDTQLEIVKFSDFSPAYLNRQSILLLLARGIHRDVFYSMYEHQKQLLEKMMTRYKEAKQVLGSSHHLGPFVRHICNHLNYLFDYPPEAPLGMFVQDPFLFSIFKITQISMSKSLQQKTKLAVHQGAHLLGIMDTLQILNQGEIFVQIQRPKSPKEVITGKVICYRNPCLHPGDILILNAVDNEMLSSTFTNVVVFPSRGTIPHAKETSGGDLDGDTFNVIWDPSLIPVSRVQPMLYDTATSNHAKELENITIEQVQKFFFDYIQNDMLGVIANAWVAYAEMYGASHEKCVQLAKLHSTAVDFAKHGVAVERSQQRKFKPESYPDYMQRPKKSVFVSKSVIGEIYRDLQLNATHLMEIAYHQQHQNPTNSNDSSSSSLLSPILRKVTEYFHSFFSKPTASSSSSASSSRVTMTTGDYIHPDMKLSVDLHQHAFKHVVWRYHSYCKVLVGIMNQYKFETEIEAITGFCINSSLDRKQSREKKERVAEQIRKLQLDFRTHFFDDLKSHDFTALVPTNNHNHNAASTTTQTTASTRHSRMRAQVLLWYNIAYSVPHKCKLWRKSGERSANEQSQVRILSFAWVVTDILAIVFKAQTTKNDIHLKALDDVVNK